jgi:hypothetical protein
VEYRGFGYHASSITAIPRILDVMLETPTSNLFELYFEIFYNISRFDNCTFSSEQFDSIISQLLLQRSEIVTSSVIETILSSIKTANGPDWSRFKTIFMNYALIIKIPNFFGQIFGYILQYLKSDSLTRMEKDQIMIHFSLIHFLFDLLAWPEVPIAPVFQIFAGLFGLYENRIYSFGLHLIRRTSVPLVDGFFQSLDLLKTTFPLELISYLSPQNALLVLKSSANRLYSCKPAIFRNWSRVFRPLIFEHNCWTQFFEIDNPGIVNLAFRLLPHAVMSPKTASKAQKMTRKNQCLPLYSAAMAYWGFI